MEPTFTVVIPTWNRAAVVGRAITAVLRQDFEDFELVVVDDGSTDATQEVLREFSDPRLRVVTQANLGESSARNSGAAAARGTYVTFLDSDDEARGDWLRSMHDGVARVDADVILCGQEMLDSAGRQVRVWLPNPDTTPDQMAVRFEAGQVAIRRGLYLSIGGYEPTISYGQHTELAVKLFLRSDRHIAVAFVPKPLAVVHRQEHRPYGPKVVESAQFVLNRYPDLRSRFPHLCGSYHAIVGVDLARRGDLTSARAHFLAAMESEPAHWRHSLRYLATLSGLVARRAWPVVAR